MRVELTARRRFLSRSLLLRTMKNEVGWTRDSK